LTLHTLAPGIHAWLVDESAPPASARGFANAGVIVDADGVTLVDTLVGGSITEPFAAAVESFGVPVKRVILTSSHIPYVGGSHRFRLAAIYGTSQISAHLDQPPNIEGYQRLYPDLADVFDGLVTRPVSHIVRDAAWLTPSVIAVPTSGQIRQNLVVQVPAANVVFAGAMCCFGVVPVAFDGDPAAWADALDAIAGLGAIIVPGHGPIGSHDDVRALQSYLRACVDAHGDVARLGKGPWDNWSGREFDEVNVERAALLAGGDSSVPPSMLRLLGMV
jgi:glyoxylase-like metal-dependent hydrolase (beta-lactamase superfamily II)